MRILISFLFLSTFLIGCSVSPNQISGVPRAAPYIYTSTASKAPEYAAKIAKAQARTSSFFKRPAVQVNYVFCESPSCDKSLGLASKAGQGPLGKAFGDQVIFVSSIGASLSLLTHEQAHADMYAFTAGRGSLFSRLPSWFNEGMAELVSLGPPKRRVYDLGQFRDILELRDSKQFRNAVSTKNFRRIYGGSYFLVADIEQKIGRAGLLNVLNEVSQGGNLDEILEARLGPSWPN